MLLDECLLRIDEQINCRVNGFIYLFYVSKINGGGVGPPGNNLFGLSTSHHGQVGKFFCGNGI